LLFCIWQRDLKAIIAYSRVNHISLIVLRVFCINIVRVKGGILLIIIHGFSSSLLFFIINSFYYQAFSRLFYYTQNILLMFKSFRGVLFLLFVLNLNFPILLTFFREIFIFIGVLFSNKIILIRIVILSIITCYYTIFILINMVYGKLKEYLTFNVLLLKNSLVLSYFLIFSIVLMLNIRLIYFFSIKYYI
jgi:NADH:ubiquinone oxidoreductase subunit 4 (subunit M)